MRCSFYYPPLPQVPDIEVGTNDPSERFSYASVDGYPCLVTSTDEFLSLKGKTIKVEVGGKTFSVKFNIGVGIKNVVEKVLACEKYYFDEHYDFKSYVEKKDANMIYDGRSYDEEIAEIRLRLFEDVTRIKENQIKHRAQLFLEAVERSVCKEFATYLQEKAPKKKNGTFYKGKTFLIGALPVVSPAESVYAFYVQAKDDTQLLVSIKKFTGETVYKMYKNGDSFEETNLLKDFELNA